MIFIGDNIQGIYGMSQFMQIIFGRNWKYSNKIV